MKPLLNFDNYQPIIDLIKNKTILYYDYPGNTGDLLITDGTNKLFKHANCKVIPFVFWKQDADLLVFRGGGYLGDLYKSDNSDYDRLQLATHFAKINNLPIIVLPSSITTNVNFFESDIDTVFTRELESQKFYNKGILVPDIGLLSTPTIPLNSSIYQTGIFLRTDRESSIVIDNKLDPALICNTADEYYQLASKYHHIITDRLHFAIAALTIGKKVTLLPNSYHKNKAMYETWLKDLGCRWADSLELIKSPAKFTTIPDSY